MKADKVSGIYLITVEREGNLPLYYVGQSIDCARRRIHHFKTLKAGRHDNDRMQKVYNKYGLSAFSFKVVQLCSHDLLDDAEQWWLDEAHGHPLVMNIAKCATSPNRGRKFSEEVRRKVAEAGRGRVKSDEAKRLLSASLTGRVLSQEVRQRISITKKSRSSTYKKMTGSLHHSSRSVEGTCIKTGEKIILESTRQGALFGFPDNSAICKVCKGLWPYYKGYTWRYIEEARI